VSSAIVDTNIMIQPYCLPFSAASDNVSRHAAPVGTLYSKSLWSTYWFFFPVYWWLALGVLLFVLWYFRKRKDNYTIVTEIKTDMVTDVRPASFALGRPISSPVGIARVSGVVMGSKVSFFIWRDLYDHLCTRYLFRSMSSADMAAEVYSQFRAYNVPARFCPTCKRMAGAGDNVDCNHCNTMLHELIAVTVDFASYTLALTASATAMSPLANAARDQHHLNKVSRMIVKTFYRPTRQGLYGIRLFLVVLFACLTYRVGRVNFR